MSSYKSVYLKRGKEESLRRFHPWVFSGAIEKIDESIAEGDIVKVVSSAGECLAVGHFQIGSIAVRVLSFEDRAIDESFWDERLLSALRVRESLRLLDEDENNIFRLVYGEGDELPGLVIDCYKTTAIIQAHSVGMHLARRAICESLIRLRGEKIKNVYYKSETTLPFKANLEQENEFLYGGTADDIAAENGLKFHIDWLHGQKTGFFIDQRDNRMLLEHYAKDRRVLNMFCYTGGFSVYAMRGGAREVHSVDSSEKAIDLTDRNIALNFPKDERHTSFCEDAFKFLNSARAYDLIILDPPAFAKHRMALKNALKGYIRLNALGLASIQAGGILFTFSCSQIVTKEQFRQVVLTAALRAGRRVRILHQLHQSTDHPINLYHPEGEYLKGLVLYVE